jgi:hypothetical protein
MAHVGRRLRARVTAVALAASLVGGAIGIEALASHLSGEQAHSDRSVPAPAPRIETGTTADISSVGQQP